MDEEVPNDLLVMGCAYTPRYGDEETTLFKYNDMTQKFADSVTGLPVHIEHDTSKTIGEVRDAFINERRQLMTLLHLSGDPVVNKLLPAKLFKNPSKGGRAFFNDLSLGNDVGFKLEYNTEGGFSKKSVTDNVPAEVSIVGNGNRPMTDIENYWILPKNADIGQFINEHVNPFIVRHH